MGHYPYRNDIRSDRNRARGGRPSPGTYGSSSIFSDEDLTRGGRSYGNRDGFGRDGERGAFARASDEVRSWFGDDDAERRREADALRPPRQRPLGRSEGQYYGGTGGDWGGDRGGQREPWGDGDYYRGSQQQSATDHHYLSWRDRQITDLDRDYAEYAREQRQQFGSDFDTWRRNRQMSQGSETGAGDTAPAPDVPAGTRGRGRTKS